MSFQLIRILEKVAKAVEGAAVRAIRMDLIEWSLVFDLDLSFYAQDGHGHTSRAWLIFPSASDVTATVEGERIGAGFRIDGLAVVGEPVPVPRGAAHRIFEIVPAHPWRFCITIVAADCILLRGLSARREGDWYLRRDQRLELGTDEELLQEYERIAPELNRSLSENGGNPGR